MIEPVTLADGRPTVCERMGSSGVPMLALHGLTSSAATWRPFAGRVAPHAFVVAFDQRGHGAAGAHPGPYRLADAATDAIEVARHAALRRPIVVGHSWGGATAVTYAGLVEARDDAAPRGLLLIDPVVTPVETAFVSAALDDLRACLELERGALRERVRRSQPEWGDDDVDLKVHAYASLRPATIEAIFSAMAENGTLDLVPAIAHAHVPVLLCLADLASGSIVSADVRARLTGLSHVEMVEFPGAGHSVHRARPQAVADVVRTFVERCGA